MNLLKTRIGKSILVLLVLCLSLSPASVLAEEMANTGCVDSCETASLEAAPPAETTPTEVPTIEILDTPADTATPDDTSTASPPPAESDVSTDTTVSVTNEVSQQAVTGDATLVNDGGGTANSGNSLVQTTVINLAQTEAEPLSDNGGLTVFTINVDGDVLGDLVVDPSDYAVQPSSHAPVQSGLDINTATNVAITNNLELSALSGDAAVASNGNGGTASSGNATVVANVINAIHSAISAGSSFIGTININGNLNGDILLPPGIIDELMAANTPSVTVPLPNELRSRSGNSTVVNTTTQSITNYIDSEAISGDALVNNGGTGGWAASGSASTSVTIFNLTGSSISAENSILVYVNVLGRWTGFIVSAPQGATVAALSSGGNSNYSLPSGTTQTNTTNQTIVNTITVRAVSGDATVTAAANGGSATTGKARTAVNIVNIENSFLSAAKWFGILFINVFGNWIGSFGVNTSAGGALPPPPASVSPATESKPPLVQPSNPFLSFAKKVAPAYQADPPANPDTQVLGKSTAKLPTLPKTYAPPASASFFWSLFWITLGLLIIASERLLAHRRAAAN